MAVTDIAKIQVRHGLQENLPQLDAGEFGWCTDSRRLFIGNGVTGSPDYAPEIGNTEILTVLGSGITIDIATLQANVANLSANVATLTSIVGNLSPRTVTLLNNTTANIGAITIWSANSQIISYNITRNTAIRIGSIKVTNLAGNVVFDDEFNETISTGVTLSFSANANAVVMGYTTTNTGDSGNLTYVYQNLGTIPY
jgi:hypothetical protein